LADAIQASEFSLSDKKNQVVNLKDQMKHVQQQIVALQTSIKSKKYAVFSI